MQQTIAFFDFDGTITTKDTLLEFIKFAKGKTRFYIGFLLNSPWLIAMKLHLIGNQRAKERILTFFFRNIPIDEFQSLCSRFVVERLPSLIRPKAIAELAKLKAASTEIVFVSASPENWIRDYTESIGAALIATKMETKERRLTGRIDGRNCHGHEKVARIKERYTLADYERIFAYGDSSGDKPMLGLASSAFFKPFR